MDDLNDVLLITIDQAMPISSFSIIFLLKKFVFVLIEFQFGRTTLIATRKDFFHNIDFAFSLSD